MKGASPITLVGPGVLLLLAACGSGDIARDCLERPGCLQAGIEGSCLPSPASEHHWCAFPDPACPSGDRWGVLAGDDLAKTCVESAIADAGVDAPVVDASVDAAVVDAALVADAALEPDLVVAAGSVHTCILRRTTGQVKCWGRGTDGELGQGNTTTVGDDEFPNTVPYIDIGSGVTGIAAGSGHTCALLTMGRVRCWGQGTGGALGYGNLNDIGDNEEPVSAGNVDVGGNVTAVSLGTAFTCAVLDTERVRCWGQNGFGQLGYGHTSAIGDNETPASAGDVNIGANVVQVVTGARHVCALTTTGTVRCWGDGSQGRLGYGNTNSIGNDEAPATAGDVNVGGVVMKLAAGASHTCALLASGSLRCWGANIQGYLGYAIEGSNVGDDETPASMGDVNVGAGTVIDIAAAGNATCVLLIGGVVRCWGQNSVGALGYGNTNDIGDNETPASAGDVDVGGAAARISVGGGHVCVVLASGALKCWGGAASGRLGYGNLTDIGDNESPSSVGTVPF